MDLSDLTDEQLRFELKLSMQNYIFLVNQTQSDRLKREALTLRDEHLGQILAELKLRRESLN